MALTRKRRAPTLPKFFREADVRRLLSLLQLRGRDRGLLEVLIATGLRASELLALDAGDIGDDCLFVRRGKGGKSRYVPLSQRARRSLDGLLARAPSKDAPVFTSYSGARLSRRGLHRIVAGYLRAAGLQGSLHSLRHTAATRWLNHDLGLRSVQTILGHSDISTTAIYLGVATDALVAEYRRCLDE